MISEDQARLLLHDTPRKRVLCTTEVTTIDSRREEPKRREIKTVEGVEEVCLELEKCSFSEERRQARSLREAHVYGKVPWTTERVATNARRQHAARIVRVEEIQATTRKVSKLSYECFVVSIFKRATEVSRRPRRANEVVRIG